MRPKLPPIHACIERCDLAELERLLSSGADVEERDPWGQTPLFRAVVPFGGWSAGVALLLRRGADANARLPDGSGVIATLRSGVSSAFEAYCADEIEALLRAHGAKD